MKLIVAAIGLVLTASPAEAAVRKVVFDYLTEFGYGVTFGSLAYDDANSGVLTYNDLLSFSFNTGLGGTYDLAYVREQVLPADGIKHLGYNTASKNSILWKTIINMQYLQWRRGGSCPAL